jgi:hypothetical protein
LQRVLVDFGAEHAFGKAAERLREHYCIEVPVEAIRQHTLKHGRSMNQLPVAASGPAKTLVVQMDGTMIPVVQPGSGPDARKGKQLLWREARLCLARSGDKAAALYGSTLGTAETAAWVWREAALAAGLNDIWRSARTVLIMLALEPDSFQSVQGRLKAGTVT